MWLLVWPGGYTLGSWINCALAQRAICRQVPLHPCWLTVRICRGDEPRSVTAVLCKAQQGGAGHVQCFRLRRAGSARWACLHSALSGRLCSTVGNARHSVNSCARGGGCMPPAVHAIMSLLMPASLGSAPPPGHTCAALGAAPPGARLGEGDGAGVGGGGVVVGVRVHPHGHLPAGGGQAGQARSAFVFALAGNNRRHP